MRCHDLDLALVRGSIARRAALGGAAVLLAAAAPLAAASPAQALTPGGWNRVARCESGDRWNADTGNGFQGGLQFTPSTWAEFGGDAYTPHAADATRSQQIAVANRVLAVQGPGAWPVCSATAGLAGHRA
ncbi:transglycosylase family protein [Streptomyces wuyuanensis]|uniref:transglycosylase family protein n=1 Tax=Streptomyces wuyuanensis TaxID=1196353 RepID=UPI00343EC225